MTYDEMKDWLEGEYYFEFIMKLLEPFDEIISRGEKLEKIKELLTALLVRLLIRIRLCEKTTDMSEEKQLEEICKIDTMADRIHELYLLAEAKGKELANQGKGGK